MKCYKHNNKDAVGQCSTCNKGVCDQCAVDVRGKLFCRDCVARGTTQYESNTHSERRDPGIAAVLSLIFPGAGQVYNGELKKFLTLWGAALAVMIFGFLLVAAHLAVGFFIAMFLIIPIWMYGIFDAYKSAKEINRKLGFDA